MKAFLVEQSVRLLARLPLRAVRGAGALLGWLLWILPNRRRHTTFVNLALCFPEYDAQHARRVARHSLIQYGGTIAEAAALWARRRDDVLTLVEETHGEDVLKSALAENRGVLLAMPHIGQWELVNLYCSIQYGVTTLYRRPRLDRLDTLMRAGRERFGARLVPADARGVRALYRALDNRELVAILPDQVPAQRAGGEFAPFFGVPALSAVLLSRLAIASKAPVIFACAERRPGGRYRLRFEAAPHAISDEPMEQSLALVNRMIESQVRSIPQQYQWCYKRFRVRADGDCCFYTLTAKAARAWRLRTPAP